MSAESNGKTARLFLALWPDDAVRARLVEMLDWLKRIMAGRWVKPDNLHMTLVFLGEVDEARWPEVHAVAAGMAGTGFRLVLDQAEFWPRNGIVCLAPGQTPPVLKALADGLARQLRESGFSVETRPYRAHLTLARKGRSECTRIALPEPVAWEVGAFCLVESRPGRDGTVYLPRESWPLQGPETIPESRCVR